MIRKIIYLPALLLSLWIMAGCSSERDFRFAIFSDTHIMQGTDAAEDLRAAVNDANQQHLDFVLVSGDITEMNIGDNLRVAKEILDELNVAYYIIPGNHDTKWSGSGGRNFRQLWGDDKFVFEHHGFTFIGLHQGPVVRMADGHISPEDLRWLDEALHSLRPANTPVILITHYPVDPSVDNWYKLLDRLEPYNVRLVIHGHGHRNRLTNYEGIPAVMVRSTLRASKPSGGYTIARVKGDRIMFYERRYDEDMKAAWAALSLVDDIPEEQVNHYELPDYSVNERFPEVGREWVSNSGYTTTASPVHYDDRVYIGDGGGRMQCLDIRDGGTVWEYPSGGPIYATAAVKNKRVVFTSTDSAVYALDAATGKLQWRMPTGASNIAVPVIGGNNVFVGGSDGTFRALDLATGNVVWEYADVSGYVETRPVVFDGKVIFGAWDETLYALSPENGNLVWKWQGGRPGELYSAAACWPVASKGHVYVVAPDRYLSAISSTTGMTAWRTNRFKVRENIGISTDGRQVFARCMNDTVFAVRTGTGRLQTTWVADYDYGYDISVSMPVEKDGTLFFGTKNGLIIAADAETGSLKWKHKLGNAMINTVCPVDRNSVLVSSMDGTIGLISVP